MVRKGLFGTMDLILFVGPKKTGTTSVYDALKTVSQVNLFPKESSKLILESQNYISQLSEKKVNIDVSPQYFTSLSAMYHLFTITKKCRVNIQVFIIHRSNNKRLESHFKYIKGKGELYSSFKGSLEIDTMLSGYFYDFWVDKWKAHFNVEVVELDDLNLFMKNRFNVELPSIRSNEYRGEINFLGLFLKWIYRKVERIIPLKWSLLFKSKFLSYFYREVSNRDDGEFKKIMNFLNKMDDSSM